MNILERYEGCSDAGKEAGCYGPIGDYYTLFGSETRFLLPHLIIAIVLGGALFGVMIIMKKKRKTKISMNGLIIISIVVAILLFFIFAFLFPVKVIY